MADVEKDRLETIKGSRDFVNALDDGDSLSSVDYVRVFKARGGIWREVSAEFGIDDPTNAGSPDGSKALFTLGAASSPAEQDEGEEYRVRIGISTANGEELVGRLELEVTAEGLPKNSP